MFALPLAAALAACGSKWRKRGGASKQQLKVVGSSTVYPFTTAVAEEFQRANPDVSVIVESTGTGAGIKLFCGGVGANFPDIVNASRQMKKSEYESLRAAGVKNVIEVPIGIDGLTLIEAKGGQPLNLTQADIYKALAANPFGKGAEHRADLEGRQSVASGDQDPRARPAADLGHARQPGRAYLDKGCESDPAMKALKKTDEDKHKDICTKVREDGAFVEAGENDNLLVQKVTADPGTLGVLGYRFLEENADKVRPVQIDGVAPTEATIADLTYPGARKLYIYVKGEHLAAKPAIRDFVAAYAKAWGKGGPLEQRGLVPFGGADAEARDQAGDRADAARSGDAEVSRARRAHDAWNRARRGPADRLAVGWIGVCRRRASARGRAAALAADLSRAPCRDLGAAPGACCCSPPGRRCRRGWSTQAVLASPEGQALPDFDMQRDTILAEAREIAHGESEAGFNPESTALAPRFREAEQTLRRDRRIAAILVALGARGLLALRRRDRDFRARTGSSDG